MKKDKRQILLPTEDIISRGSQDLYLNIELEREFEILKKEKLDNNFDLAQQFRRERNASKNFFIYGSVDSNVVDTDRIEVELYWSSETTSQYFIASSTTTPLVYNQENVFGKKRGKYYFDVPNFNANQEKNSLYLVIRSDGVNFLDQVIQKQIVFYDLGGNFIEYGTETVDFDENNNFIEISNNFPFFYNKHWVKQDINIIQVKPPVAGFEFPVYNLIEGATTGITISLNKPSAFGVERLDVFAFSSASAIASSTFISPEDYSYLGTPLTPVLNTTLRWLPGEQNKVFTFSANTDTINELTESIYYKLTNFVNIEPGLTQTIVNIEDATERRYVQYIIPQVNQNRFPYTSTTSSSILRNGHFYDLKNEEFYYADRYRLEITNEGINTVFPEDNGLISLPSEQIWTAGQTKVFDITPNYSLASYEEIKLTFLYRNSADRIAAGGQEYLVSIDGVNRLVGSAEEMSLFLNRWENTFDKPFSHVLSNYDITIKSKSKGHPLNFFLNGTGLTQTNYSVSQRGMTVTAQTVNPYRNATPLATRIKLCANSVDGNSCIYKFVFKKRFFRDVIVPSGPIAANAVFNPAYLSCEYSGQTMPFNRLFGSFGFMDCIQKNSPVPLSSGPAYINGINFLVSENIHNTNLVSASWRSRPINTIPCSSSALSVKDKPKMVRLRMVSPTTRPPYNWSVKVSPTGGNNFINFLYSTNTASPTTSRNEIFNRMYGSNQTYMSTIAFAKNNPNPFSTQRFPNKSEVFVYKTTTNSTFVTTSTDTYYPYADQFRGILLSGANSQVEFILKDPVSMTVETVQEREVAGRTVNRTNNYLGGFNTIIAGGPSNGSFVVPL